MSHAPWIAAAARTAPASGGSQSGKRFKRPRYTRNEKSTASAGTSWFSANAARSITPSRGLTMVCSIFIASRMSSAWPFLTLSPAFAMSFTTRPGMRAVSRASGIVALALISLSVTLGLAMAGRVSREPKLRRAMIAVHEHAALAALIAIAVHAITLLGDTFLDPGPAGILVPFRMDHEPLSTGLGIIAAYLAAALGLSFYCRRRIGAKRCASSYAYRSLLDAGAKLAFGSDWPVAPLDPIPGLDAAVNRRTLDGKHPGGWFPEQRISIAEAVEAYTLGSAYGASQEKDRGSLSEGKLADFVVLSRDILDPAERDHIGETKVALTFVGGKVVYERK